MGSELSDKFIKYSIDRIVDPRPPRQKGEPVSAPLYKLKGEFFKTLGHPARIRVLELLVDGERSVSQLMPDVGLEASHLSQQLGVLRRAGVVRARKQGNEVIYSLTSPAIAELMRVARTVLAGILSDQTELLEDLVAAAVNDAMRAVEEDAQKSLGAVTGGMNMPGVV